MRPSTRIATVALITLLAAPTPAGAFAKKNGLRPSDPHLNGARDMNYDHLIVPGQRIGPARIGGSVQDAVQHLGNPDQVIPKPGSNIVGYIYKDECIRFEWEDAGPRPLIKNVAAMCPKWSTAAGIHPGSSMDEVLSHIGQYCSINLGNPKNTRQMMQFYTLGASFTFWNGRNSNLDQINIDTTTTPNCN